MAKGVNVYVRLNDTPPRLVAQNLSIGDYEEITVVVPIEVNIGYDEKPRAPEVQRRITGCTCDICTGMGG